MLKMVRNETVNIGYKWLIIVDKHGYRWLVMVHLHAFAESSNAW